MSAAHRLDLTGGFRLVGADGADIRVSSRKGRALLAIVALSPGLSVSRAKLRGLLWGERGEQQSADSLRQQLALLRKELGPATDIILAFQDDQIGLVEQAIDIDVKAISEAMARDDVAEASRRYRGQLLDGLDLGDQAFEDWLSTQRHEFTSIMMAVLTRAAELEHGLTRIAIAQRLVDLDPLREASYRVLIAAAIAAGEPTLARKHYDACAAILQRELGVKPEPETAAVLDDSVPKPLSGSAVGSIPTSDLTQILAPFAEILALGLVVGLFLAFGRRASIFGTIAFVINFIALASLEGVEVVINLVFSKLPLETIAELRAGPLGFVLLLSSILFLLGTLAFVISLAIGRQVPRIPLALYFIGALPIALRAFVPEWALDLGLAPLAATIAWLAAWLWASANADSGRKSVGSSALMSKS